MMSQVEKDMLFLDDLKDKFPSIKYGNSYMQSTWRPSDYCHPGDLSYDQYEERMTQTVDLNIAIDDIKHMCIYLDDMKFLKNELNISCNRIRQFEHLHDEDVKKRSQLQTILTNNPDISEKWNEVMTLLRLHGLDDKIPINEV